jgi:hypothetical protein
MSSQSAAVEMVTWQAGGLRGMAWGLPEPTGGTPGVDGADVEPALLVWMVVGTEDGASTGSDPDAPSKNEVAKAMVATSPATIAGTTKPVRLAVDSPVTRSHPSRRHRPSVVSHHETSGSVVKSQVDHTFLSNRAKSTLNPAPRNRDHLTSGPAEVNETAGSISRLKPRPAQPPLVSGRSSQSRVACPPPTPL